MAINKASIRKEKPQDTLEKTKSKTRTKTSSKPAPIPPTNYAKVSQPYCYDLSLVPLRGTQGGDL